MKGKYTEYSLLARSLEKGRRQKDYSLGTPLCWASHPARHTLSDSSPQCPLLHRQQQVSHFVQSHNFSLSNTKDSFASLLVFLFSIRSYKMITMSSCLYFLVSRASKQGNTLTSFLSATWPDLPPRMASTLSANPG